MERVHTILMIGFRDAQVLDITGPLQMFQGANNEQPVPAYQVRLAGPDRGAFRTTSGLMLHADIAVADIDDALLDATDTLIFAGGEGSRDQTPLIDCIDDVARRAVGRVGRIVSVCTGAFFLARAGLLARRRVTTHWAWLDELTRMVPNASVEGDAIFLKDHIGTTELWTSAGVTAGIDLALALIEADLGRTISLAVARQHVVYRVRPGGQAQFSDTVEASGLGHDRLDGLVARVAQNPSRDWRIETLADEAAVSIRTLNRLFQTFARMSPARFVERIRLDHARTHLTETADSIDRIAGLAGFGSLRRMERAFIRTLGVTPTDYRARFRAKDNSPTL